ncbi:unnamed protein product [Paramecium pentaurelia]|uniref:RRM domain-containing protein n=1 Tax=Paramecium pentaurelia TaxID=43138 RepID=A0A8S1UWY0_9CILI|nr:unnamed protein product [Paramecium pentaurelia]
MLNSSLSPPFQNTSPQKALAVQIPSANISAKQKIHVSNLPLNVAAHQLQQAFQSFGNIIDIRIIRKTPTGLPLHLSCYAFITFAENESAEKAIQNGSLGDWTVKPQIDKQMIIKQRSRSRSRSRSQEKHRQVLTSGHITPLEPCPKIQIQLYVRELFVNGISKNYDEPQIRQIFSQFGYIERIDLYPNKHNIFNSYIKFFTIDQAIYAFQNMDNIQQQFSTPIKIYFSDPIKRHNIVGNNLQNEQQSKLSSVLFIFFPPNLNKKVDHAFLFEICQNNKCRPLLWNYYQQDSNYKSYTLLQFKDTQQAIQMRTYLQQNAAELLGDPKCEVGIVSIPTQQQFQNQFQPQPPIMIQQQQQFVNNILKSQQIPPQQIQLPYQIPPYQLYQQPIMHQQIHHQNNNYIQNNQKKPQQQLFPDPKQLYQNQNQISNETKIQSNIHLQQQSTQIQQNGNQEILDGFLNFSQIQQRQDLNDFWSGFMYRSKSHRVGVDAFCVESDPPIQMSPQIQVNYKGNYSDAKKCANESFKFILCPSDQTQNSAFQEYIDYFLEKNKIGVAQLGNGILYLLPPCEITNSIKTISGLELLAIFSEEKKKSLNYSID